MPRIRGKSIRRKIAGSDAVVGVGYDPVGMILEIEFDHGGVYEYYDVGPVVAAGFETASSKGEYFNDVIRGAYKYARIG